MTPSEFIATIGPAAQACFRKTGIPASFTVAQAALESRWGDSGLTREARNLFGIKSSSAWHGPVYEVETAEYVDGNKVMQSAQFRSYDDWQGSIDDHAAFLQNNPRYRPAFSETTGEGWARAVAAAGYATDPQYASKIVSIIEKYDLAKLDTPAAAPIEESKPTWTAPTQSQEEPPMVAPILSAILPSLIGAVPELAKLFGSGSEVATRNAKAVEIIADVAKTATNSVNEQQALERIQSDPAAKTAYQAAIRDRYFDLVEAGGGGIGGARKADIERQMSGKPFYSSATFVTGLALLPLVYLIVISVTFNVGGEWTPELRGSIASSVIGLILGAMVGYYFGASRNAGSATPLTSSRF